MKSKFNSGSSLVITIVIAAVALAVAGGAYYYYFVFKSTAQVENSTNNVIQDAKPVTFEKTKTTTPAPVVSDESLSKELDSISTTPVGAEDFSSKDTTGL